MRFIIILMLIYCFSFFLYSQNESKEVSKTKISKVEALAPINKLCPIMKEPINAKVFVIYKEKKIAFCCSNCKSEFDKKDEKWKDDFLKSNSK